MHPTDPTSIARVLDVGNCDADHGAIRSLIESQFAARVVRAHNAAEVGRLLREQSFELVLVNRLLDEDQSSGLELITHIKRDPALREVPVMMITNFPDHQQLATRAGARPGFGKRQLHDPETLRLLGEVLPRR
jgi:two-component system chemotaxis response regulator CheY